MTGLDGITEEPGATVWWGPEVRGGAEDELLEQLIVEATGLSGEEARALLEGEARRYLVLRRLAASSHATVYLALDRVLAGRVVLKLHEDSDGRDEARWATLAKHPNVVQVYDHSEHEGRDYTVLAWCEGTSLDAWCEGKPWREVLARIIEAGRGLQHCHENKLVHGDVKPQNILVTQGRAVVADFGLAGPPKLLEEAGGTLRYIAPELARTKARGPKADVYALAVTAWCCLFGEMPYADKSVTAAFLRSVQAAPEPPAKVPEDMPDEVTEQLVRALIPEPRSRPMMGRWLEDLAWAAEERERRQDFARHTTRVGLAVVVAFLLGMMSHSVRGACVEQGQIAALLDEPSMDEAIAAAVEGDPFGAYSIWWRINEVDMDVENVDHVRLAEAMLEATRALDEPDRSMAAGLTDRVASLASFRTRSDGQSKLLERAKKVLKSLDALSPGSRPSRPR